MANNGNPNIVYINNENKLDSLTSKVTPIIALVYDKWDDYHYNTQFNAYFRHGTAIEYLGPVRIMVEDEKKTSAVLVNTPPLLGGGQRISFGNMRYISLGYDEYYEKLKSFLVDKSRWEYVLSFLHDVVYLKHRDPQNPNLALRHNKGFRISLLRGSAEIKAYGETRKSLYADELKPDRFNFGMQYQLSGYSQPHNLYFRFDAETAVPTYITVLIGKNGVGKSQALYHLVDYLLSERRGSKDSIKDLEFVPIEPLPPFKHIIAVSFSPFEQFPVTGRLDSPNAGIRRNLTDNPKYTYCGFYDINGFTGLEETRKRSVRFLFDILLHDLSEKSPTVSDDPPKLTALLTVLREGLGMENIVLKLKDDVALPVGMARYAMNFQGKEYFNVALAATDWIEETIEVMEKSCLHDRLWLFGLPKVITELSAGQEMFVFVVFSTVASIKNESLILIDEPEIFLHPNLEVSYMRMLTTLLSYFESYAIISTHSIFIAREVPRRNVRVLMKSPDNQPIVFVPPIDSFGADLSEIANLVFDNVAIKKPFEYWLESLIGHERNFDVIKSKYGKSLNLESLTYLRNKLADRRNEDRDEKA